MDFMDNFVFLLTILIFVCVCVMSIHIVITEHKAIIKLGVLADKLLKERKEINNEKKV